MKILDTILILALIAVAAFTVILAQQPTPVQAAALNDYTNTTTDPAQPQAAPQPLPGNPAVQITVGLVVLVFGTLTLLPIIINPKQDRS